MPSFTALMECQPHAIALALAHAESIALHSLCKLEVSLGETVPLISAVRALFALEAVESGSSWFFENGYIETSKSVAIRNQVDALCAEIAPHSAALVSCFGLPDSVIRAPIGLATQA